ncbi:MAG: hypothetical protein MHM6MM_007231 [Cercozoa sp. M6MM]
MPKPSKNGEKRRKPSDSQEREEPVAKRKKSAAKQKKKEKEPEATPASALTEQELEDEFADEAQTAEEVMAQLRARKARKDKTDGKKKSAKSKKGDDFMTALFAGRKKKSKKHSEQSKSDETEATALPPVDDDFLVRDKKGRTYTNDGLPVYTTTELKIGQGGDTPLCPFDCECCY